MKKISHLAVSIILLFFISSCAGYKPLYTTDLNFEIADYSLKNNKKLGKKIYNKLNNLSKTKNKSKKNIEYHKITIEIETVKNKIAMAKDTAGKVLEYKIIITSNIVIKDYFSDNEILGQSFSYSLLHPVQSEYSETVKLENKNEENIINKIFQNLLIMLSDNLIQK
jgi:hypothetical protein